MAEEFENILDECIDRLRQGESIEQCLQRYPEQASQLEPLLEVALATQEATSIEPRPEFRAQAREQLRSILYKHKPETRKQSGSLMDFVGSILKGLMSRPVYQKAMAGVLVIALAVGLGLGIPAMFGQSNVALAEETAIEDPGVQVLMAEKGFHPSDMKRIVMESGTENIYIVHFVNPEDGTAIGNATVNIKDRLVTDIGMIGSSEHFDRHPGPPMNISEGDIIQIAESDSQVQEILDSGAEVVRITPLLPSSSPGSMVAGLQLQKDNEIWWVRIDLTEDGDGEVTRIFRR